MAALIIGVVIAVNVIAFALTQAFSLYLYYPDRADLTLSGTTDEFFADAIEDGSHVTVMFCQAEEDVAASGTGSFVLTTAKNFAERYPDFIGIEFVNIITGKNSKNEFVDITEYQQKDPVTGKLHPIYKTSVIFIDDTSGRSKVLTDASAEGYASFYTLDSTGNALSYNGEEMMAAMVNWVLTEEHKTAYFTTSHGEVADIGLGNMLIAAGYNIDTVDLRKNSVPKDSLVVISNPVKDFERAMEGSNVFSEIERLRDHIENGGAIYVAIDPYTEKLEMLESFLKDYGITISSAENNGKILRNIVRDSRNAITADSFTLVCELAESGVGSAIAETLGKYTDKSVIQRECAALELSGGAEPVLISSSASETYAGDKKTDNAGSYCIGAVGYCENEYGERGRVFVTSSIYLTSTDALVANGYSNRVFIYSLLESVFLAKGNMPYGCNTVYYNTEVLENLTMGKARLYTALIMTVPTALAVTGAVIVTRRKNS